MDQRIAKYPPQVACINTDRWTAPFWEGCRRRELLLPRCAGCATYRMPPTPFCPRCHAQDLDWVRQENGAVLYSYTIVDRAIAPGMEDNLPYVPAIVEFPQAQRVRLISNIVGSAIGRLHVGSPLSLTWMERTDGLALPAFAIIDLKGEDSPT